MKPVQSVDTLTNIGIKGDMHAIEHSTRQVLLIEQETLISLGIQPGDVKENITTSGLALMSLKRKQELHIGEVILQITIECKPCERMEEIRPGLQEHLQGKRGMLARVVRGGSIRVGELIQVV